MVDFTNPELRAEWTSRGDRMRFREANGRQRQIGEVDPHDPAAVEEFIRALDETSPKVAELVRKAIAAAVAERCRYHVIPFGEWTERPRQPYVIARLLRRGDLAVIYGPPKSKKSFVALDAAARIAAGKQLWGRYTTVPGPVVYCTNEGVDMIGPRINGWLAGFDGDRSVLARSLFVVDRVPRLLEPGHRPEFVRAVKNACGSPALVVLDTLSGARGSADENDAGAMQGLLDAAEDMRKDLGCAVLAIHHSRRNATGYRGSGVLEASADIVAQVAKSGSGARLSFDALKDSADPGSLTFTFDTIDLGRDEHDPDMGNLTTLRVAQVTATDTDNSDPLGFDGKPLNGRELAILRFLETVGADGATPAELRRAVKQDVGAEPKDRTHRADLSNLDEREYVAATGGGKGRRYVITERAARWVREVAPAD